MRHPVLASATPLYEHDWETHFATSEADTPYLLDEFV